MSYILDALRKADAERERGHVPGIHAQPAFTGTAPSAARAGDGPPWVWIVAVGVLAMIVLAGAAWFVLGGNAPRAPSVALAPPPSATPAPALPAPPPNAVAPVTVAPNIAPATSPEPAPARKAAVAPARAAPRAEPAAEPAAPPARPKAAAPASTAASAPRVYAINELPDDVRRALPALSVGGSVYSATPANRILIVGGQVLHEGDAAAPELLLRQIRPKSAVLEFRGFRYELPY